MPPGRYGPARRRAAGFTLLEVIVSLVVMGLMLAGFVSVYSTLVRHSAEPTLHSQAVGIASAYLEEIVRQPFRDPDTATLCPAAEGSRAAFDNVCDYDALAVNGCAQTSAACPALGDCACDRAGQPVDGLRAFRVAVAVAPVTRAGVAGLDVAVTVNHDALAGTGVVLQSFRTEDP